MADEPQKQYSVDWHFAVPVYAYNPEAFLEHKQPLIDLILEKQAASPGITKSNRNAWHSEIDLHLWDHPSIKWMNYEIGQFCIDCTRNSDKTMKVFQVTIASAWANVTGFGGWNAPHSHHPHNWSGVFYLDVEDCLKADSAVDQQGCIEFLNPINLAKAYFLPASVTYRPKNGQMLLFPSGLAHFVHPNLGDTLRYSIAFNVNITQNKSAEPTPAEGQSEAQPEHATS